MGVGGYWQQANQSNGVAGNTIGVAGAANYYDGDFAVTQSTSYSGSQNYLTDVGAYGLNSGSAYGTNDQAGNVYEWNDSVISGWSRGMRGGCWNEHDYNMASADSSNDDPASEFSNVGFRVAGVPEPTSLVLTMLAGGVMFARRKR